MSNSLQPHGLYSPWNSPGQSGYSFPSPGYLPSPGIKPRSPALQVDSLPTEPPGKPKNTGVGSLSLLQQIFPTKDRIKVGSPALQADSSPTELSGKPLIYKCGFKYLNMQETIAFNIHRFFNMTSIHSRKKPLLVRKLFICCNSVLRYSIRSP